jgi:hypothetical protein
MTKIELNKWYVRGNYRFVRPLSFEEGNKVRTKTITIIKGKQTSSGIAIWDISLLEEFFEYWKD